MKRAYSVSSYAKLYEKYCKENLPSEADGIFKRADEYYREFHPSDNCHLCRLWQVSDSH